MDAITQRLQQQIIHLQHVGTLQQSSLLIMYSSFSCLVVRQEMELQRYRHVPIPYQAEREEVLTLRDRCLAAEELILHLKVTKPNVTNEY